VESALNETVVISPFVMIAVDMVAMFGGIIYFIVKMKSFAP
jgi:hypothetical protein